MNNNLRQIRTASELGDIVRHARKKQGITQADLALITEKSHVLLRDIETGKGSVSFASVLQVLNELGIRMYVEPGQ